MKQRYLRSALCMVMIATFLFCVCKKKDDGNGDGTNSPPATPAAPFGPSSGGVNDTLWFSAVATDPDTDSVAIRFDWGNNKSGWSSFVASGESVHLSHAWADTGTYNVKAQAKDQSGDTSAWSDVHTVVITPQGQQPPMVPMPPAGPDSGVAGISCTFTSWTEDPDFDSVAIRFDWGDGNSNWSGFVASGESVRLSHSWADTGAYNVKAQAKDQYGAVSDWSDPRAIMIVSSGNMPPGNPVAPSGPASGLVDTVYTFSTWAIDPELDSLAVRFDCGDGDTSDWSGSVPSGTAVSLSHAWTTPGVYHVRAQARDEGGAMSGWSEAHEIAIVLPGNGQLRSGRVK